MKVGCYGCIDGSIDLHHRYQRLLQVVFGDSNLDPSERAQSSTLQPSLKVPAAARADSDDTPNLAALLKRCIPPERTPAASYLSSTQYVWPPAQIGPRIPSAVRWVPASDVVSEVRDVTGNPPRGAAGCVVYVYTDREGLPKACELEALRCDGVRCEDFSNKASRWRRTYGDKVGSMFRLRRTGAVNMVVAEDPLAAWWLFPYSSVAAVGGKSELASIDPAALPPHTLVRIFMDEDHLAGSAAGKAERRLVHAGFDVQLGSHEWEFNTDLKGVLTEQIAESSAPRINWMPGASPEPSRIYSRKRGTHLVREEVEAWRPFLDPEEEPYDRQ